MKKTNSTTMSNYNCEVTPQEPEEINKGTVICMSDYLGFHNKYNIAY